MLVAVLALFFYAAVYFAYQWMQTRVNAVLGPDTAARHLDVDGHTANQESTLFTHEAAIQQILAHNIFNAALDTRPPQAGQNFRLHELAASSGPLELLGTVSGSDSDARAIIRAGAGQREQLYRLGDVIQGAEIVRIERGRVALATKTGPELLLLKERDSGPAAPAQEGAALLEENPLLTPLQDQADSSYNSNHASSRIVPQALPGRRINTTGQTPQSNQAEAAGGVSVRTGAAALQPLEVPWEIPENPATTDQDRP